MLRERAILKVLESDIQKLTIPKTNPLDHLIRKAAKGGGIAFIGNVIHKVLRFLLEILLARVLGAGGYGSYSLGLGLAMIGSKISMLGLSNGVVRFAALYKGAGNLKRVKGTLNLAFLITTLSSITAGGLLFLLSGYLSEMFHMPELVSVLRIFAFAFPFYVITLMIGNAARAFQEIKYEVMVTNICRPLANVIIVSIVFLLGFRLFGAAYGFLISSAVSASYGLYLLKKIFPDLVSELKPSYEPRKLLRFSLPILFVGFSSAILEQTDRIMLGYFKASKDVGIYTAAAIISQQAGLITYSFSCIFCPIISDLYNRNEFRQIQKLYKTVTRWIVSLNLVLLLLLILFSKQIMEIFGPEFTSGWIVLVVLSSVHLVGYSTGGALAAYALQMSGKQDIELINATVMMVLNVMLNFWLIPIYGILGAAIATGASYAVINIARIVEVYKLLRMHPYDTNYHKLFIAGFAVIILYMFLLIFNVSQLSWILSIVILIITYFATLYFLGLEYEDKMIWETIKRRIRN